MKFSRKVEVKWDKWLAIVSCIPDTFWYVFFSSSYLLFHFYNKANLISSLSSVYNSEIDKVCTWNYFLLITLEYASDLNHNATNNFLISYYYLKNAFIRENISFPVELSTILERSSTTTTTQSSINSTRTVTRLNINCVLLCSFADSFVLLFSMKKGNNAFRLSNIFCFRISTMMRMNGIVLRNPDSKKITIGITAMNMLIYLRRSMLRHHQQNRLKKTF